MADAACRRDALVGIESPDFFSRSRVERHYTQFRRGCIKDSIDDDRITLHLGILECVVRVVAPGELEPRYVGRRDLGKRRVADVIGSAIDGPFDVCREAHGGKSKKKPHGFELYTARSSARKTQTAKKLSTPQTR